MITITADNRALTRNAKYSYLTSNNLSGVSSLAISNSVGFSANDYVLLGEFGAEQSEIVTVSSVNTSTHTLNISSATKFAHSQDTRATIMKYNQVKFYHTTTATFNSNPANLLETADIQADSRFTITYDTTNTTGFGWFVFYNSTTSTATQSSNAIPYAGFSENSVRNIIDNFYSLLNNKETKLISNTDAYRWMNEAYAMAVNELNLVNQTYNTGSTSVSTTSGTQEYELSSTFSKIISVYDEEDEKYIENIDLHEHDTYDETSSNKLKYYIVSSSGTPYIGFSPVPSDTRTITVRYKTKSSTLDSPYDNIDLPDNNHYCLIDYMLYRAAPKLGRPGAENYYKMFIDGLKRLKVTGHKQDANLDSFTVDRISNI